MEVPKFKLEGFQWLVDELGLQLIKLRVGKKIPVGAEKGWASRTEQRSFKDVKLTRNDNAGVLTGRISGIIVLDIDDATLFPPEYQIPDTFTVKTAKGFHHYYKLPDDGKSYGNRAIGSSGFDIRTDGGYVVAPWSRHPDGITYTISNDSEIIDAPQWLLELAESTATPKAASALKIPVPIEITQPEGFKFPHVNKQVIKEKIPKGKRSEQIWRVLHVLVELGCQDEDILYIFETHPEGIGEKYIGKGASRVYWLQDQLDKVRKEHEGRYAEPVEAKDQAAVETLTLDIVSTLRGYGVSVTEAHEQSVRGFVNLLIAMYEGSATGWYAISIPVGGGKTQTLLHFIKYLYEHDKKISFPISVAFEKIKEIESAAEWLMDKGVPEDFFQVVHHKVPDVNMENLPNVPVILHTHQKLSGSSYLDDYFKYDGKIRKLLIYDESMLNALVHSESTSDISSKLSRFQRAYDLKEELQKKIPEEICKFFQAFNKMIEQKEKVLRGGIAKEVPLTPDTSALAGFKYLDLVRYSRIIEAELEETDLYRTLLLAAYAPSALSKMSLVQDQGKPAILVMKEILDSDIENIVTTDASREFRRLFKYTNRPDGKKVRIYNIENFRQDDELGVIGIPLKSGRDSIRKAFDDDPKGNAYLNEIAGIVRKHNDNQKERTAMNGGNDVGPAKYLFFYPKTLKTIPSLVELRLIKEGLIKAGEADELLHFETFGRETATNEYKDCEVIVFIGLNHKPKHTIKALLAGERFLGDPDTVLRDVETGEFLQQLQQGIGRGTLRKGERQVVYFFHHDIDMFADAIQKAFPLSYFNGKVPAYCPPGYSDGPYPGGGGEPFEPVDPSDGSTIV